MGALAKVGRGLAKKAGDALAAARRGSTTPTPTVTIPGATPTVPPPSPRSSIPSWLGPAAAGAGAALFGPAAIRFLLGGDEADATPAPAAPVPPQGKPPVDQFVNPMARGYTRFDQGGTGKAVELVAPGGTSSNFGGNPDIARRQYMRTMANRYRQQIAANPALMDQIMGAYDSGARPGVGLEAGAGTAHMRGARAANAAVVDSLGAQKEAQQWLNVDSRRRQENAARAMGVPRGYIMAQEDVQASLRSGNKAEAAAKAAMYGQMYPGFALASTNLAAMHAADAAASKDAGKDPLTQLTRNASNLAQMPAGAARFAAMQMDAGMRLGQGAKPDAMAQALMQQYQPIMRGYAQRLGNLSADELMEMQQLLGKIPYAQLPTYLGVPDTRQLQDWYRKTLGPIAGQSASWAQFGDNFGVGNLIRHLTPWDD